MKQQTNTVPVYQVLPRLGWTIIYYVMFTAALLNVLSILLTVAVGIVQQEWRWASLFGCALLLVFSVFMATLATYAIELWDENGD